MDAAIVGPALSGKTTVFRALTAGHAGAGPGHQERLAAVKLPDERLLELASLVKAKKITPVEAQLHDLPPLFQRDAARSREASQSLAKADALILVARAFHRDDVPHPAGSVDPHRDIREFEAELLLSDLAIVERRLERIETTARTGRPQEREAAERERQVLLKVRAQLESDRPLREEVFTPEEMKALSNFAFLSLKPLLIVVNLDEADAPNARAIEEEYRKRYTAPHTSAAAMCARLEADLADLPAQEAQEFRNELGGGDVPGERILHLLQEVLRLIVFYTAGDETRAWTVRTGAPATEAAGRIHTDIERGFVRAEVISWNKLLEYGSTAEARKHGALRTEGKQYVVQDGDVINVLFH